MDNKPLNRIKKVDFGTRFKDIVGVTIPDDSIKVEQVLLKFDKDRFPYVVSKPIHHSQTTIDEEQHLLQIEVRPNKELEALLLSFGPQVEILQPKWLRQQFAEKIQECFKIYSTVQKACTHGS